MVRRSTLFALAAAVAGLYAVTGVLQLIHDQPTVFADPIDYWIEAAFAGALALSVVVLASLARVGASSRARAAGWTLAAGGHAALLVAALATAIDGREALDALFPLGFLAIVAGYVTLAVLDLRKRLLPSRAGLVLLIGFVGAVIVSGVVGALLDSGGDGGTGGGLVLAASWAALARLISEPMEPSPLRQPSLGPQASTP
jgi:hypothetical protein